MWQPVVPWFRCFTSKLLLPVTHLNQGTTGGYIVPLSCASSCTTVREPVQDSATDERLAIALMTRHDKKSLPSWLLNGNLLVGNPLSP